MQECSYPGQRMDGDAVLDGQGRFHGSFMQLRVMAAVVGVRSELEDIHQYFYAPEDARVEWLDGSCSYGEIARLSPEWLAEFKASSIEALVSDIMRFDHRTGKQTVQDQDSLKYRKNLLHRWLRPVATDEQIERLLPLAREAVFRKSGAKRYPAERLERALRADDFFEVFFANAVSGNLAPLRAVEAGEPVRIKTTEGWRDWEEVSHLSDNETMAFNIALCDRVFCIMRAIDRAREWPETDRMLVF